MNDKQLTLVKMYLPIHDPTAEVPIPYPKMPEINSVIVTRSIEYSPESYLEFCKYNDMKPTQEGFHEFIQDWIYEDFRDNNYEETITVMNY